MSIHHFHSLRIFGAICAVTVMACATAVPVNPMDASEHPTLSALPTLERGEGRIVLYRKANAPGPSHALTLVDVNSTFDMRPGRFAHLDHL